VLSGQDTDRSFLQLVLVFEAQAMVQLGKVIDPGSKELERDMSAAGGTISLLEMLERKTRGNLSEDEQELLKRVLTGLRMNYLDELRKEGAPKEEAAATSEQEAPETSEAGPPRESAGEGEPQAESEAKGEDAAPQGTAPGGGAAET
jgi:hypothetical protein